MLLSRSAAVAVTGADGHVGRTLLRTLDGVPVRTIALSRTPCDLPANALVAGPLDGAAARAALEEADCVVHLAGALRPTRGESYEAANVHTAQAVARALRASRAGRVIFLSYVGARGDSPNAYLRAKALAEHVLAASGKEVVVFRCTHIVGGPAVPGPLARALTAAGGPVTVPGDGRQPVAPLFVGDVAAAIRAAMNGGAPGTYELAGPERMTLDDLVRLVNRNPRVPIRHVPATVARALARLAPRRLPAPLVDVMLRPSVADPARAAAAFGLNLTPLTRVWR